MTSELSFIDKIKDIQQAYVASKTETNDFGGYAYRNIEKMLASLKPLLKRHSLLITFTDRVHNLGDRYYVQATAKITDGQDSIEASAYAREELEKKKSDASQLTGSASTYARKYALSGLLGVDDGSNDPDSQDNDRQHYRKPSTAQNKQTATPKQVEWLRDIARKVNTKLGDDAETDAWIASILTIKPSQVPSFKVRAAVDKLLEEPHLSLPDPDVQMTEEQLNTAMTKIESGELPY